jgi:hypothetical protein
MTGPGFYNAGIGKTKFLSLLNNRIIGVYAGQCLEVNQETDAGEIRGNYVGPDYLIDMKIAAPAINLRVDHHLTSNYAGAGYVPGEGYCAIGSRMYRSDVPLIFEKRDATGDFHKIYHAAAAPVGGAWLVGDRTVNLTPAVGQPKAWVCTVAGVPGTWVSEGNL